MRKTGGWIVTLGVIGAVSAIFMNVAVSDGSGGYVNNIGLIADRQNYLIAAGLAILVGVILIVSDRSPVVDKAAAREKEAPLPYGIERQDDLYVWGDMAFASRDEAETHVKQRLADHAAKARAAT